MLSYIDDIASDLEYIISKSHKHINNDHQKLKLSQIRDLNEIHSFTKSIFKESMKNFENNSFTEFKVVLGKKWLGQSGSHTIQIPKLPAGNYFLNVTDGNKVESYQIVVQ